MGRHLERRVWLDVRVGPTSGLLFFWTPNLVRYTSCGPNFVPLFLCAQSWSAVLLDPNLVRCSCGPQIWFAVLLDPKSGPLFLWTPHLDCCSFGPLIWFAVLLVHPNLFRCSYAPNPGPLFLCTQIWSAPLVVPQSGPLFLLLL